MGETLMKLIVSHTLRSLHFARLGVRNKTIDLLKIKDRTCRPVIENKTDIRLG